MIHIIGKTYILALLCVDSQKKTNKYGPSPKYIWNSNNVTPNNNYIPPNALFNQFLQPNSMAIPVNSNYTIQQKNNISDQNIPFPQPVPFPNQDNLYPQQNPIPNEGIPYPQQNPNQKEAIPYPQQNPNPNEVSLIHNKMLFNIKNQIM